MLLTTIDSRRDTHVLFGHLVHQPAVLGGLDPTAAAKLSILTIVVNVDEQGICHTLEDFGRFIIRTEEPSSKT